VRHLNTRLPGAETFTVNTRTSWPSRAALATAIAAILAASPPAAEADDLDALRSRAQAVADEVSALEHRLAELRAEKRRIHEAIDTADRAIGALELRRHETERAYENALDDYVARAVDVYKSSSPGVSIELLLSARDLNDLIAFAHLTSSSAEAAREALAVLRTVRNDARDLQDAIDTRKQRLLAQATAIEAVKAAIDATLTKRRRAYNQLNARIAKLEAEARREARLLAASATSGIGSVLSPDGRIAAGIPPGFAATGVSFEGIASWYGPGFEGQTTANGDIFDPAKFTAASRDLPLGSWLYVEHEGKGVVVYVNDRGPYIDGRVLDLSQAAAEAIGITGLGWIRAEVLVKL
jgi:rare lipoprotein A